MSDEQTIYISPEDELTAVRERLEQIQARHLTMVIPPQTQLRSHIAWKLLYARARELGKEIVIVSSDPQVRSVAHAVKFKVAHSLESSPTMGRSHPTSRSGHASGGGVARTRSSSHLPSTKATSEPRSMHSRRGASNMGTTPPARTPKAAWHGDPQDRLRAEDATAAEIDPQAFDAPEQEYRQPHMMTFALIRLLPFIHLLIRSKNQICYWRIIRRRRIFARQLARAKSLSRSRHSARNTT